MSSSSSQLSARSVSKSLGSIVVLDDVSLRIGPRSRIGLLGPNGVGKSTLLRILAGVESPDEGQVERSPASLTVGLLDQEPGGDAGETMGTFLARSTGIDTVAATLEAASTAMSDDLASIEVYTEALERFDRLGGHDFESRASALVAELGLPDIRTPMDTLSGGQRTRAALAAIELARVDVLLLDEPTNDLDAEALARLEAFVRAFPGGIVVVSHDRAFLDASLHGFLELDPFTRRASAFTGTWSEYAAEREHRRRQQRIAHDAAVAERARLQRRAHEVRREAVGAEGRARRSEEPDKFVRFSKITGAQGHASGAAKLERQLERIEVPEAPRNRWTLHLDLAPESRGGDGVVRLAGAVVDRGSFRLGPLDVDIARGDRVALIGRNGSGKTTLLRTIAGELTLATGRRSIGPSVVLGVLDQERAPFRRGEDVLAMVARGSGVVGAEARSLLAKFELGADDVTRPCEELSPGERTRAMLAVLAARRTNLLLLDEPTNHLDLDAIEQLEHALSDFDGTFVIATHDRRLLETIGVTRAIELGGETG